MEETWELAAVNSLARSGPEPSKYSVGREDNDWSARHVRLRFEMVISATIFFLVASYGVTVVDFPFIELPDGFNPCLLYLATFVLAVFALVSFLTRSQYEKALWPKQELLKISDIDQLGIDFEKLLIDLPKVRIEPKERDDFLLELKGKYELLRIFSNSLGTLSIAISDLHYENGVNSPVHPKFWNKMVSLLSTSTSHSSFLVQRAADIKLQKGEISSGSYDINYVQDGFIEHYERLSDHLNHIKPELDERVIALKRHSRVRRFQTSVLSVWLPGILSTILILIGSFTLLHGFSK